jgi:hypothetical protein
MAIWVRLGFNFDSDSPAYRQLDRLVQSKTRFNVCFNKKDYEDMQRMKLKCMKPCNAELRLASDPKIVVNESTLLKPNLWQTVDQSPDSTTSPKQV